MLAVRDRHVGPPSVRIRSTPFGAAVLTEADATDTR